MSARQDPRWQAAHAEYIAEHGDPDTTYQRRVAAATRMYEVEREHNPALPTVAEVLSRLGT